MHRIRVCSLFDIVLLLTYFKYSLSPTATHFTCFLGIDVFHCDLKGSRKLSLKKCGRDSVYNFLSISPV